MKENEYPPEGYLRSKMFERNWLLLPLSIQRTCLHKLQLLAENPRHPSLHVHAVRRSQEPTWICYLSVQYRLLFQYVEEGAILLLAIGSHTIVDHVHKHKYRSPRLRKRASSHTKPKRGKRKPPAQRWSRTHAAHFVVSHGHRAWVLALLTRSVLKGAQHYAPIR